MIYLNLLRNTIAVHWTWKAFWELLIPCIGIGRFKRPHLYMIENKFHIMRHANQIIKPYTTYTNSKPTKRVHNSHNCIYLAMISIDKRFSV